MLRLHRFKGMVILQLLIALCMILSAVPVMAAGSPALNWTWSAFGASFMESTDNTGLMLNPDNYVTVTLVDGGTKTFALTDGTEMTSGTHYKLEGELPSGVVLHVLKVDNTHLKIYLSGNAAKHNRSDNVDDLKVTILAKAFSDSNVGTVQNLQSAALGIQFYDSVLVFNPNPMTFNEAASNDGSILATDVLSVTINGSDQFIEEEFIEGEHFSCHHVPAGLVVKVERINNTRLDVSLEGNAAKHDPADNDEIEISFADAAFVSGSADGIAIAGSPLVNVVFTNPSTLSWSSLEFVESALNDGSIDTVLVATLTGDEPDSFTGPNAVMAADLYKAENIPAGLTIQVYKSSASRAEIRLLGKASEHLVANSISNLRISFKNAAFEGGDAGAIAGTTHADIKVTFADPADEPVIEPPADEGLPPIVSTFKLGRASYQVNGESYNMDAAPYAESERTFVPVRYLGYAIGLAEDDIVWDEVTRRAFMTQGETTIYLELGSNKLVVNGVEQLMDVQPQAVGTRVYLPARWVAEAFGCKAEWVQETQTAIITRQ